MKQALARVAALALALGAVPAAAKAQFVPAYGYPAYGYNVNTNTGNLYGSARMVDAQGNLMLTTQQAKLMQEQVKQSKMDTHKRAIEEWKYERNTLPTTEDERRRMQSEELRRSRYDPPATEIFSAYSLNTLLKDLQRTQATTGGYSSPVMLSPDMLKHINLAPAGGKEVSVGLFRGDGVLQWPYALREPYFDAQRKELESLSKQGVEQAKAGQVDFNTLQSLNKAVDNMEATLKQRIADIPSNRWIEGKRYVGQLRSSVSALEDPNVKNYYTKWKAQGNTVPELVNYMSQQGLTFAPATAGDETSYTALYRAMADYDNMVAQRTMTAQAAAPAAQNGEKKGLFNFLK